MKSVGLKIIKEILYKIRDQEGECLYVGIHFPFAEKYIKLLSTEENWLSVIPSESYKKSKEITFDQASSISTMDLWVVVKWPVIPKHNSINPPPISSWSIPSFDNTYAYKFIIT